MTAIDDLKRLAGLEPYRRLLDLRPSGKGSYKALCPWHDDENPSLAVYEDGHHHCYTCGAHGDGLDLIQKLEGGSLANARARLAEMVAVSPKSTERPSLKATGLGEPVAAYPYVDESAELLYEVLRYEPKTFRQRTPDGAGGWRWGLGNVRRPLYRLPQVLAAPAVVLVEGEKDVHTLERLGFVATTNSGGASQPWREEWTDTLRGRKVVIIPDVDEPGRKHAEKVRAALDGGAESVVVVDLPQGKDVTEFIEQGGTGDELRRLIAERLAKGRQAWWESISTLGDLKPEPTKWLVKPVIPDGAFVLMAGTPGSFKSFLALDIARAIATGEGFAQLGATVPRDVLYIDLENPLNVIASRKEFLGIGNAARLRYWGRWSALPFFGIDAKELRDYAQKFRPLIVCDSLVRFHRSNENDNSEMARVMADFMQLTCCGATVLLLHHAGKDEAKNVRGAIELEGAPDVCYRVSRTEDRHVQLFQFKNRFGEERTFNFRLSKYGFESV